MYYYESSVATLGSSATNLFSIAHQLSRYELLVCGFFFAKDAKEQKRREIHRCIFAHGILFMKSDKTNKK
jgi:hypothetical protein